MATKQQKFECDSCGAIVIKCNNCKRFFSRLFEEFPLEEGFPSVYCLDNQYKYDAKTERMIFVGKPNKHFCEGCTSEASLDDEVD